MSPFVSTSRLGNHEGCKACGAGNLISFNWDYARTAPKPENRRDTSMFVNPVPLRFGALYECQVCAQPWYLCGEPAFMNFVQRERVDLIQRWNAQEITVPLQQAAQLKAIGHTPPDVYGNGSQYREFPCAVTTTDGATIDRAIVSLQRHAPFEEGRNARLATDIAEIRPSPFALPLTVRVATSKASEVRMCFAPTLVELPNGEVNVLNWSEHFFVKPGIQAGAIVLSRQRINMEKLPPIYQGPSDTVYFVADHAAGLA